MSTEANTAMFAAQAMGDVISALSERAYAAGWMMDCEFDVWASLTEPERYAGRWHLEDHERWHLSMLSREANGWVQLNTEDEAGGEYALVPMEEWLPMYADWKERQP